MARISPEAERYIGTRFLEGESIATISTHLACSRSSIESIIRGSLLHLIATKRGEAPKHITADDIKDIVAQWPSDMKAELFSEARQHADGIVNQLAMSDVQGQKIDGD